MKNQLINENVSLELTDWLQKRQRHLKVAKTTKTAGGKIIDWVPIESQTTEKIATPPPADLSHFRKADAMRPTKQVTFDTGEVGPEGHVPIPRPDITKTRHKHLKDFLSKKGGLLLNRARKNPPPLDPTPAGYFHATSYQWATTYGCDAWLNVWDPKVDLPSSPGDDHSVSQTWLQNYFNPLFHSLEAGLTVDRSLNGDFFNHLFIYYTTNGYTKDGNDLGGYNRQNAGWMQVHPAIFPGIRVNGSSVQGGQQLEVGIKYQLWQGNWWFGVNNDETAPWIWLGYYPGKLFKGGLKNEVQWVSFGGEVASALKNPCDTKDQMGSGRHADAGWTHAAYQRSLRNQVDLDGSMVDFNGDANIDVAGNNCKTNEYSIHCYMESDSNFRSYQYYGGPAA